MATYAGGGAPGPAAAAVAVPPPLHDDDDDKVLLCWVSFVGIAPQAAAACGGVYIVTAVHSEAAIASNSNSTLKFNSAGIRECAAVRANHEAARAARQGGTRKQAPALAAGMG